MSEIDKLIDQQLTWLESQTLITSCMWVVKEGTITFKLFKGEWRCTTNFTK